MSDSLRIVVVDDLADRRDHWKELLQTSGWTSHHQIDLLGEDFERQLEVLKDRQVAARRKDGIGREVVDRGRDPARPSRFDGADVLLVDYDLLMFEQNRWLTGENVAYLARCYSTCAVIVGVNLTGQPNPFDLTLVDHLHSFADVNVGEDQLAAAWLWSDERRGLSPWGWPSLPRLVDAHRQRVEAVRANLQARLLAVLDLDEVSLPRQLLQSIEADGTNDPTLEQFARGSDLGLRGDDRPWTETLANLVAARAAKWLDSQVVAAQDILSDAPHIAQRNPLLLAGDHRSLEVWDRTVVRFQEGGHGLTGDVERHRHRAPLWANRPLWRWATINNDERLPGVSAPWDRPPTTVAFCEDVSRFLPLELCRSFVVDDVPTSFATRWIARGDAAEVREAVGGDLSEVRYVPRVRLSL